MTTGSDEELLDVGRRPWATRRHRAAVLVVATAAVAAGVTYLATRTDRNPAPAAAATATEAPKIAAADDVPSFVVGIALQAGPLVDYIRSDGPRGQCALAASGASPTRSISATVRMAFPGYRIVDTGRVYDQYTGLCSLGLRARDAAGSVLVLEVVSPTVGLLRTPTVAMAGRAEASTGVRTARVITPAGWQITIGTVGPLSDRPTDQVLRDFAASGALRW